ncbi:MAG: toxin YoeB [Saprospiraceae bacterium]|jgi:toxin YoeB
MKLVNYTELRLNLKQWLNSVVDDIGNPELLKHELKGFWSRRIDKEHRLVYSSINSELLIVGCRHHY